MTPVRVGTAITLRGLRKRYGDVVAVDGVDLVVAPGEVVALLGPNGAGKSTTIDMLLGLTAPDDGDVSVFGLAPHEAVTRGVVGAMLQEAALPEDATVAEVVGMVGSLHDDPLPTAEVLRRSGIVDVANRRCAKLSGGQRQRTRFAIALVGNPDLLVLDEPTTAMDVSARKEFWTSMREFTDQGRTVLFATHYLEEAEEFADRVVLMRGGKIVADGTVAAVREAASGRTVRATLPGADRERLAALPGVTAASVRGDRIELVCTDADAAARALLIEFPRAKDLEVSSVGLEAAFLALTSEQEQR
ncbi:ABC transporter ATP-binding protein [Longimycelium tulufanense]|uniref:ABC transporter ATP-binding protein n=1 Tax=Longimycelium tulufanense TaxID=907463 RepID=A0A8J3C9N3_9PSEU|nr:ABC transporter ATP-binding protein [Longimycelium tulufanense]GGM61066.1 ABC transporter ATP-binding protein [Longimycelium tulufanense]